MFFKLHDKVAKLETNSNKLLSIFKFTFVIVRFGKM